MAYCAEKPFSCNQQHAWLKTRLSEMYKLAIATQYLLPPAPNAKREAFLRAWLPAACMPAHIL
ncbi:hypothetical protein SAMN02746009_00842 [Hymenobacter psychrotolerans DSM 18569]|uniref:Uncharacterized protein n=1 Tax=Hymenobacter psychrotolerans DSM 18569 TaxID=1121959 RepID=A0A1M6S059_9BACT|nr:hypothetical protein SAMN02746009_00842 [Hymenobacter psychrotolerans DSM 18569]